MSKAKELRDKFDKELKELQNNCPHTETEVIPWAPGYSIVEKIMVCKECEVILNQFPPDGQYELMLQVS